MNRLLVWLSAVLVGVSRFLCRGRVADDYDSIGFVRALDDFDLAKLQPHFPGYPVYVALGKLAHGFLSSLMAAQLVSALAAAATVFALHRIASRLDRRAGAIVIVLYAGAWLPWMLGGAALSDSLAAAFAALAFAFAAPSGIFIALMLGTRLSYWPIALVWLVFANRRQIVLAVAGCLAWAVPFALLVERLPSLGKTHLAGHFTVWGGSIATRSGWGTAAFLRDLFFDGIAPHPLALGALIAIAIASRPRFHRAIWLAIPYALWVFLAQNVIEQPRHLLPLVLGLLILLAWWLSSRPLLALAAGVLIFASSLPLAITRARQLPAAAQAANWVDPWVPLFGGRSTRFFANGYPRTWLSEVDVELERMDRLPPRVYLTSEVKVDVRRRARVTEGPTFCRDERIDRQQPCLTILEYHR